MHRWTVQNSAPECLQWVKGPVLTRMTFAIRKVCVNCSWNDMNVSRTTQCLRLRGSIINAPFARTTHCNPSETHCATKMRPDTSKLWGPMTAMATATVTMTTAPPHRSGNHLHRTSLCPLAWFMALLLPVTALTNCIAHMNPNHPLLSGKQSFREHLKPQIKTTRQPHLILALC